VPDQRRHRGPHPDDLVLFAAAAWPTLRDAAADLTWLLNRGYAPDSALKLVGDRYALVARQRTAVARCVCDDARAERRRRHEVPAAALAGRPVWIDGYNALTTVEAALAGGIILAARDGTFRDMASMHGSYRKVQETRTALELLGGVLAGAGVTEAVWLLDRPVSNSGRLKQLMELLAAEHGWTWRIELAANPDAVLADSAEIVATADSVILDRCAAWFNLARETISAKASEARVVEVSRTG
jgi:hypothetical protein